MRPPMCCICMRRVPASMRCSPAKGATDLARNCFDFLPTRSLLDLEGWAETDIFAHT